MTTPPEGLLHDEARRIFPALVLPFGEAVSSEHEDSGRTYGWGDVRLPRTEVPVDVDHDRSREVGYGSGFVKDRTGIWCSIKLGTEGERLRQSGHTRLSAEISDSGEIIAVAICAGGFPAFASARIYDRVELSRSRDEIPFLRSQLPFEMGRVGTIAVFGGREMAPRPPSEFRVSDPMIRDDNPPDPEIEAARLRAQFEDWQRGLREEEEFWPN